jgi:hypothetical protein
MQVTHVVGATNLLVAISAFLGIVSNRWPRLTGDRHLLFRDCRVRQSGRARTILRPPDFEWASLAVAGPVPPLRGLRGAAVAGDRRAVAAGAIRLADHA